MVNSSLRTADVSPRSSPLRYTSPAAKSEEKRMFSQARLTLLRRNLIRWNLEGSVQKTPLGPKEVSPEWSLGWEC